MTWEPWMTRCALLFGGMAWWMLLGYGLRDLVVEARDQRRRRGVPWRCAGVPVA